MNPSGASPDAPKFDASFFSGGSEHEGDRWWPGVGRLYADSFTFDTGSFLAGSLFTEAGLVPGFAEGRPKVTSGFFVFEFEPLGPQSLARLIELLL